MAELSTVARPYARALFERASETGRLAEWGEALRLVAAIVGDPAMRQVMEGARIDRRQIGEIVIDVAGDGFDEEMRNLVRLLAENRRLPALPEIAALYEHLRAEAEKQVEAEVESAMPLDAEQERNLAEVLSRRLGRQVRLKVEVKPELIGGAVIRAGDLVIDGSVRGRLEKLATTLAQ